jgi:hypothetical protein
MKLRMVVTWVHDVPSALWRTWGVLGTLALAAAQAAAVANAIRDAERQGGAPVRRVERA